MDITQKLEYIRNNLTTQRPRPTLEIFSDHTCISWSSSTNKGFAIMVLHISDAAETTLYLTQPTNDYYGTITHTGSLADNLALINLKLDLKTYEKMISFCRSPREYIADCSYSLFRFSHSVISKLVGKIFTIREERSRDMWDISQRMWVIVRLGDDYCSIAGDGKHLTICFRKEPLLISQYYIQSTQLEAATDKYMFWEGEVHKEWSNISLWSLTITYLIHNDYHLDTLTALFEYLSKFSKLKFYDTETYVKIEYHKEVRYYDPFLQQERDIRRLNYESENNIE